MLAKNEDRRKNEEGMRFLGKRGSNEVHASSKNGCKRGRWIESRGESKESKGKEGEVEISDCPRSGLFQNVEEQGRDASRMHWMLVGFVER